MTFSQMSFVYRYLDKASACKSTVAFNTTLDLLWKVTSLKRNSSVASAHDIQRCLVTGTLADALVLSKLSKLYFEADEGVYVKFSAKLALKHYAVSKVEPFDTVIHLVSHPLASIEALSKLPRLDLDKLLPQPFAANNQSAIHRAMVHWVAVNSFLEMFADTRIRLEELGGTLMPKTASFFLDISNVERQAIIANQTKPTLTWKGLYDEESDLAALVCRTGERYGYKCKDA
jgi:hypothetical protein